MLFDKLFTQNFPNYDCYRADFVFENTFENSQMSASPQPIPQDSLSFTVLIDVLFIILGLAVIKLYTFLKRVVTYSNLTPKITMVTFQLTPKS
jgi:hypothetical protein